MSEDFQWTGRVRSPPPRWPGKDGQRYGAADEDGRVRSRPPRPVSRLWTIPNSRIRARLPTQGPCAGRQGAGHRAPRCRSSIQSERLTADRYDTRLSAFQSPRDDTVVPVDVTRLRGVLLPGQVGHLGQPAARVEEEPDDDLVPKVLDALRTAAERSLRMAASDTTGTDFSWTAGSFRLVMWVRLISPPPPAIGGTAGGSGAGRPPLWGVRPRSKWCSRKELACSRVILAAWRGVPTDSR